MGILLGIVLFAVALIVLCAAAPMLIEASGIIPMYRHTLRDTISNICRAGLLIGIAIIILAIVALLVFAGIAAILYLH